ncbi:hypothetical protein F5Y04DRAFT_281714 [Hypomontagnella monticulosa]|nr:hypothetical protein F5Y04DRAFT_281714 [Hypomontagnella monticulosa]
MAYTLPISRIDTKQYRSIVTTASLMSHINFAAGPLADAGAGNPTTLPYNSALKAQFAAGGVKRHGPTERALQAQPRCLRVKPPFYNFENSWLSFFGPKIRRDGYPNGNVGKKRIKDMIYRSTFDSGPNPTTDSYGLRQTETTAAEKGTKPLLGTGRCKKTLKNLCGAYDKSYADINLKHGSEPTEAVAAGVKRKLRAIYISL